MLACLILGLPSAGEGYITVMRLAMATKVSGDEAQQFLTEKAKEFNADFKVTENGSIIYKFDI